MATIGQSTDLEDPALSPWWVRGVLIVMVLGFSGLIAITMLAYRNAPPIPARVIGADDAALFTGADVGAGQAVFLKYGLMDNGTIWGHGAYLGPDYAAEALHRIGEHTAAAVAQQQYGKPMAALTPAQQAGVRSEVAVALKTNRYDAAMKTLRLTAPQAEAFRLEIGHWTDYFRHPSRNGGLKRDLITDPTELHQLTAFVTWAAWASVANRPGVDYSYTNNFPYDPTVGNQPTAGALLWSALSLMMLLGGIAVVLLAFGKFDYLGWASRRRHVHPHLMLGQASAGQRALVKFIVIVALFLTQTLVGGATSHYRADPGSFYGISLEQIFPSNLMPTWHLQTGNLLDRHCLRRRCAVSWPLAARRRAALVGRLGARVVCRLRRCNRRQSARRVAGHVRAARAVVVLAGRSGLGVSRDRSTVAVPAGGQSARVVRFAVVAGAAAHSGQCGCAPIGADVSAGGVSDPSVLHSGDVLRRNDQLHGG